MQFPTVITVANGATLVQRTQLAGYDWNVIIFPAFIKFDVDNELYMIAEVNSTDSPQWLQLARPYIGPNLTNGTATITMDFTPNKELPIANIGDVNMADIYNRAMLIIDQWQTAVPIHGPTHVGLGTDPIPLCSTTDSGLIGPLSGNATDYVGGDGLCHTSEGVPSGSIMDFAGATLPIGWLFCNGNAVSRVTYAGLYGAIGTTYGKGDGSTTFNLPNCMGRVRVGAGAGAGLSNRVLAAIGGEELHVLSVNEMASHTHTIPDPGHVHQTIFSQIGLMTGGQGGALSGPGTQAGVGTNKAGTGITGTDGTGSNWGHNNMNPFLVTNVIIRT